MAKKSKGNRVQVILNVLNKKNPACQECPGTSLPRIERILLKDWN